MYYHGHHLEVSVLLLTLSSYITEAIGSEGCGRLGRVPANSHFSLMGNCVAESFNFLREIKYLDFYNKKIVILLN